MNTDKIYAEQIANEYAPKQTSKVKALKKLDAKAKLPATIFAYSFVKTFNYYEYEKDFIYPGNDYPFFDCLCR